MSELGAYLQRQRTEQGLSLDEVEAQTHIRRKYLDAIEAGDWDALPPGVYTRGLLKNYARVLGINSAGVQRMYVKERPSEARLPEPQLISRPLIETPRVSTELLLGVGLLVVALGLFAWTIWTRLIPSLGPNQLVGAPTRPAGITATVTRTPGRATARALGTRATPVPAGATVAALPIDTTETTLTPGTPGTPGAPAAAGTPTTTAPPAATATVGRSPTASPAATVGGGLVIDVVATSDAWLSVRTDQQKQFEGFLRAGDRKRWNAREIVRLRTGNAGATEVTLNGRKLDALGKPGAVVEREWKLLASGDIQESS